MDHIRDLIVRAVAVLSRIKPIEGLISLVSGVVFSLAGRKPTGDVYRNENAEQYHQRHEKQEWWHTEHREFGSLIHRLPPKISVLDVPFGTGRFMPFYIERGIEVTGADVSEDMLRAAEGIWKENLSSVRTDVASVLSLPYACSTFDLVVCFRLLQMVLSYDEAKSALNELARVSKRFLILELNFRPDSRVIYGLLKPDRPMANLLGKSQLFEILSDLGLEILETRGPLKGSERQGHYAILLEKRRTEVLLGD